MSGSTLALAPFAERLGRELDVDPRTLLTVWAVETPGYGLTEAGPLIRLEVHHLWLRTHPELRARVDDRFHVAGPRPWEGHVWKPTPTAPWEPLHRTGEAGQVREWAALTLARTIDEVAADESTSWGLGQVLGERWRDLGYSSLHRFVRAQQTLDGQVNTFRRILVAEGLIPALRAEDWETFARAYNGSGQVAQYAAWLSHAHARIA